MKNAFDSEFEGFSQCPIYLVAEVLDPRQVLNIPNLIAVFDQRMELAKEFVPPAMLLEYEAKHAQAALGAPVGGAGVPVMVQAGRGGRGGERGGRGGRGGAVVAAVYNGGGAAYAVPGVAPALVANPFGPAIGVTAWATENRSTRRLSKVSAT